MEERVGGRWQAILATAAMALGAGGLGCSAGGGGEGGGGVASTGVITGFSSVFVNGVRYEVEGGTVVAVEGEGERLGDDGPLRLGMKVRIRASQSGGRRVAERIDFDEDLKGPVVEVMPSSVDPRLGTFVVLGQTVTVDANTVFDDDVLDNDGLAGIDVRDLDPALFAPDEPIVVEVSGFPTAGGWLATRIDRVGLSARDLARPGIDDDELELKGFVEAVASDGSSFTVAGVDFEVDPGTVFEDGLAADAALVGRFVEVKADLLGGGVLLAVRVEVEDDFGDMGRSGELEIEGVLQSVDLSADPHRIVIDGRTLEVRDASSLATRVGNRIEIEGRFDPDGVLIIRRSKLEVENTIRTEDRIASVDRTDGSFTTRLGLVLRPSGTSRLEDDDSSRDDGDRLTPGEFLDRIAFDDFIEARGIPAAGGAVEWTRIERDDDDDLDCRLRGPVESITGDANDFTLTILGVTIRTDGVDDDDFEGADDASIGRAAFFDQLDVGDVVQATSFEGDAYCQTGLLDARELEFEPEDGLVGSVPPDQAGDGGAAGGSGGAGAGRVELSGTPSSVAAASFVLGGRTIGVVGNTLIDDSIVEAALGREIDGGDRRFDQLPAGLGLPDLLGGGLRIRVVVSGDVAIEIEDVR